jgi:hypothetical protein
MTVPCLGLMMPSPATELSECLFLGTFETCAADVCRSAYGKSGPVAIRLRAESEPERTSYP